MACWIAVVVVVRLKGSAKDCILHTIRNFAVALFFIVTLHSASNNKSWNIPALVRQDQNFDQFHWVQAGVKISQEHTKLSCRWKHDQGSVQKSSKGFIIGCQIQSSKQNNVGRSRHMSGVPGCQVKLRVEEELSRICFNVWLLSDKKVRAPGPIGNILKLVAEIGLFKTNTLSPN